MTKILSEENLTKILFIGNLSQINPAEYTVHINSSFINNTVYMYIMLPYSSSIGINESSIINKSVFLGGYTLFELHINSTKLIISYSDYLRSLIHGIYMLLSEILLPILLIILIKPAGSRLKKLKFSKSTFKYI